MSQFYLKSEPDNQYAHILVYGTQSAVICGFSCFTVNKDKTYKAKKLDMSKPERERLLVPFEITGVELKEKYEFWGDQALMTWEGY
jgi:hypothetical protein